MASLTRLVSVCAALSLVAACGGNDGKVGTKDSGRVVILVAPLPLDGVSDAAYTLRVKRADGTVLWTEPGVRASQHPPDTSTGRGSLSYIGDCDAESNPTTVELELETLWGPNGTPMAASEWHDPGMLWRTTTCTTDADVRVEFKLTLARSATQGFFDIAVAFDDLFCSAELDCPGASLAHADGEGAGPTAVVRFACTADSGESLWLYFSEITLTCGDAVYTLDPSEVGLGGAQPPDVFQTSTARAHA